MVVAETVQIDGGVVALLLAVLAVIVACYIALLVLGARVVRRGVQADATSGQVAAVAVVAALDLLLLITVLSNGRGSIGTGSGLLVAPAAVHVYVWLTNRPPSDP